MGFNSAFKELISLSRARSKFRNQYWQTPQGMARFFYFIFFYNIILHELRLVKCSFQLTGCLLDAVSAMPNGNLKTRITRPLPYILIVVLLPRHVGNDYAAVTISTSLHRLTCHDFVLS
jgi:hypothetical protein